MNCPLCGSGKVVAWHLDSRMKSVRNSESNPTLSAKNAEKDGPPGVTRRKVGPILFLGDVQSAIFGSHHSEKGRIWGGLSFKTARHFRSNPSSVSSYATAKAK